MTDTTPNPPNPHAESPSNQTELDALVLLLRRKEQTWVDWGNACVKLQKAGYNSQKIFEETGFEPVHQNQVTVGAQVYSSLVNSGASEQVKSHFLRKGSDILYEFRILTQEERVKAADLILSHQLDADEAREIAKAMKEFSRFRTFPPGFSNHPGDIFAYQCWKFAREKSDLQERSRLIAKGLKLVHTPSARRQLEELLIDFTVIPKKSAPRLPVYRLEGDEEFPRILAVVGKFPLSISDWKAVPFVPTIGPFQMVKFEGVGAWVSLPGWQVIRLAEDPVVLIIESSLLPHSFSPENEEVLMIIDRSQRVWNVDSYFLVDNEGQLDLQWFDEEPNLPLLGRLILVMRPPKVLLEEGSTVKNLWQIDE